MDTVLNHQEVKRKSPNLQKIRPRHAKVAREAVKVAQPLPDPGNQDDVVKTGLPGRFFYGRVIIAMASP